MEVQFLFESASMIFSNNASITANGKSREVTFKDNGIQ